MIQLNTIYRIILNYFFFLYQTKSYCFRNIHAPFQVFLISSFYFTHILKWNLKSRFWENTKIASKCATYSEKSKIQIIFVKLLYVNFMNFMWHLISLAPLKFRQSFLNTLYLVVESLYFTTGINFHVVFQMYVFLTHALYNVWTYTHAQLK